MRTWVLLSFLLAKSLPGAGVELVRGPPQAVFGGGLRAVEGFFRNPNDTNVQLSLEIQLLQASSATAAAWSEPRPWRTLVLAPTQTCVERPVIEFPSVPAETPFLVRFVTGRRVVGLVPVSVFPGGLLTNLGATAKSVALSSVDPELQLALVEAGFSVEDSSLSSPHSSDRPLAIYGPLFPESATASGITEAVSRAKTGGAVVLILPDQDERMLTAPSFYPVTIERGTLVLVRAGTLVHIMTDPLAQRRLIRILRLALGQERLESPRPHL